MSSSRSGAGAAAGIAFAAVLLSIAGCGGGSASKSAGAPAASPSRSFTADQVHAALLTDAEVPHTKINPQEENSDFNDEQDKVGTGGAACQKLVDATSLLWPTYRPSAEFNRDLLPSTKADPRYDLTLAVLPGDAAQQVMADIQAGLAGCRGTYVLADTSGGTMWDSVQDFQVGSLGDSAVAYLDHGGIEGFGGNDICDEFVRVGSIIVHVSVNSYGHQMDAGKLKAHLASVIKAQVAKLEAS